MNYCTISDIKEICNQSRSINFGTDISNEDVASIIASVQSQIDIRLCFVWQLPLVSPIPVVVKDICATWSAGRILNVCFGSQYAETSNYSNKLINDSKKDLRRLMLAVSKDLMTFTNQTRQTKVVTIEDIADAHLQAILEEDANTDNQ